MTARNQLEVSRPLWYSGMLWRHRRGNQLRLIVISKGKQDATLAASGVKIPVNVKMSASMVARLYNPDRDMRTRVLTNPSNKIKLLLPLIGHSFNKENFECFPQTNCLIHFVIFVFNSSYIVKTC